MTTLIAYSIGSICMESSVGLILCSRWIYSRLPNVHEILSKTLMESVRFHTLVLLNLLCLSTQILKWNSNQWNATCVNIKKKMLLKETNVSKRGRVLSHFNSHCTVFISYLYAYSTFPMLSATLPEPYRNHLITQNYVFQKCFASSFEHDSDSYLEISSIILLVVTVLSLLQSNESKASKVRRVGSIQGYWK